MNAGIRMCRCAARPVPTGREYCAACEAVMTAPPRPTHCATCDAWHRASEPCRDGTEIVQAFGALLGSDARVTRNFMRAIGALSVRGRRAAGTT